VTASLLALQPGSEITPMLELGGRAGGGDWPDAPVTTPGCLPAELKPQRAHPAPARPPMARKTRSYFLYDCPAVRAERCSFPSARSAKGRHPLESRNARAAQPLKPESQDLCLADHHGSMKAFLDATCRPSGRNLPARWHGFGAMTASSTSPSANAKGFGRGWREPLQVLRIDAGHERVVVAPRF